MGAFQIDSVFTLLDRIFRHLYERILMRIQLKIQALVFLCLQAVAVETAKIPADKSQDPQMITGQRQLTFAGPRAGEGYFSADGKKMVFQSERSEKNPFYQIFVMDLETGKTEQVSTGSGKTTCAWIHPSGQKVMFSSTHLDPKFSSKVKEEFATREKKEKSKYSWSYDETFDIFETDIHGRKIKRLTKELGYDAEGSYSPDGKKIIFASNRAAYDPKTAAKMTEEDKKFFAQDPAYMMDIYSMNADGSQVRQLTDSKGYDGGPFMSPDGQKITWRRFTPDGRSAEIYVMNSDGSDQHPVTKLKAMSWAPFFHPSGDYIIFTTNLLGYSNFELYIVDTKGEKEPVRVSYMDGFDGLPVFTPDGHNLTWTRKNEKGDSQIYWAHWDDHKARLALGLPAKVPQLSAVFKSNSEMTGEAWTKDWLAYLSSDEMAGRLTGSAEEKIYTARIADSFKKMGLVPAVGKDFIVPFEFTSGVELGASNTLNLKMEKKETKFKVNEDFIPLSFSEVKAQDFAAVAFAGYGINAPAGDTAEKPAYDSYENLDVKGKWVLIFRDIPEEIPNTQRIHLNLYSKLQHKALVAKNRGAIGLLITGGGTRAGKLIPLRYEGSSGGMAIPVISVTDKLAQMILEPTGKKLADLQKENDYGKVLSLSIDKVSVSAQVDLLLKKAKGLNVLAKLPASGAKTSVLVGAHGDHLGRGQMGNTLATNTEAGQIHHGADDNASGVAGVMEISRQLANDKKASRLKLKQNVIFAVWSGEEIGLLGSSHFLEDYLDSQSLGKISANLNMDMIGRLRETLTIQGVGSASEWKSILEGQVRTHEGLPISMQDDPYVPSDSMTFYLKNIPALTFFTGAHTEYHTPRDVYSTINFDGLLKIANFVKDSTVQLASSNPTLTYKKVEAVKTKGTGSWRVYLGTIPDYTQDAIKGVKISGTSAGSPAEKAGLKSGDVITELANIPINNLYDYMYCLQGLKPNQEALMKVSRQGKLVEMKIVPVLRE
jgi:Tol biopolymer transport system component